MCFLQDHPLFPLLRKDFRFPQRFLNEWKYKCWRNLRWCAISFTRNEAFVIVIQDQKPRKLKIKEVARNCVSSTYADSQQNLRESVITFSNTTVFTAILNLLLLQRHKGNCYISPIQDVNASFSSCLHTRTPSVAPRDRPKNILNMFSPDCTLSEYLQLQTSFCK